MIAGEPRADRLVRSRCSGFLSHEPITARLVEAHCRDLQLGGTEHHLAVAALATECLRGAQQLATDPPAAMRAPHRHAPQLGGLLHLLLDADHPDDAIRREAEEETGYRITDVRKIFAAYMSPGSVTEQIHFFVAEYADTDKVGDGGGHASEGEDIEVIEVKLDDALAMVEDGRIVDAKTIILLYHARLKGFI